MTNKVDLYEEQFFSRYPGVPEFLRWVERSHRSNGSTFRSLIHEGRKDMEIFNRIVEQYYPTARGDFKEFLTRYVALNMRAGKGWSMFNFPLQEEELRIFYDQGLSPRQFLDAKDVAHSTDCVQWADIVTGPVRRETTNWYGAIRALAIHHYRKVGQVELIGMMRTLDRMVELLAPGYLETEDDELIDLHLSDEYYNIIRNTIRRELKIDPQFKGYASIKRIRKLTRRWNQVDGQFIKTSNAQIPYHLQGWISPTGDTVEGYTFTPLTSDEELKEESREMDHCVDSYTSICLSSMEVDGHHIYKIEGRERATMEVKEEFKEGKCKFSVSQIYGEDNKKVTIELEKAAGEFVRSLNKTNSRFDMEGAHKIRREFHEKIKVAFDQGREDWRKAITYLLAYFPEMQYLLDKEEELYPEVLAAVNGGQ